MVCSFGSGRMAVMARLLAAASVSPNIGEEVGYQKFAAQMICKELSAANEANFLDEEDMHVFGLKPMDDPLHLVCCNACKRPVKASQYAAHAELCRSLNSIQESTLELDGRMGQRKPPRKERKKSSTVYANQSPSVGEPEISDSVDADGIAVSQPRLDGQIEMNPCFSTEAKRNPAHVGVLYMMDRSGVSPGNTNGTSCGMLPPTKRFKMISDSDPAKGVISASEVPNDSSLKYKTSGQARECSLPINDCPLPLATKVYYSQKSNRLRSALCHLYHEAVASTKELCSDVRDAQSLPSMQNRDKILAQSSEVCLEKSIGCLPDGDFSHQFPGDNISRPQVVSGDLTRSKVLSKPYSFAGNSGQSLGTMQQQNGSVHVI